ncbi:DUF5751 family protein [Stygiolobus caldivivus]|uniref:DUF5751 domain-containing protein n=1 Tax=Stygiolobus caldivivus TaxID=2824673 RepID=A0A8D5U493_9CREN|nr:DUF5751 family protein [Stygiolobus caldivivus]BCU68989.1 hypothetical protein KN1_02860 [Stygiolobus caldivivus]
MKTVIALVAMGNENLEKTFRKLFSDARSSGSKKVIINVISDQPFHKVVDHIREAMLDNIDIGYELFLWKKDETEKVLEKTAEMQVEGVLLYCDTENRNIIEKIFSQLPNKIRANLLKDNCRNPSQ